jgi:hypothetical protein
LIISSGREWEQEGVGVGPDPDGGVIGAGAEALAPEVETTDLLVVASEDDRMLVVGVVEERSTAASCATVLVSGEV